MHSVDEKVDAGLYDPQYKEVELSLARDIIFSQNQTKRRSLYFEGKDEIYLVGGQPNVEKNLRSTLRNLSTAP